MQLFTCRRPRAYDAYDDNLAKDFRIRKRTVRTKLTALRHLIPCKQYFRGYVLIIEIEFKVKDNGGFKQN